jgi:UDP-N-acetyl-D-galactosamine dehydrogenase
MGAHVAHEVVKGLIQRGICIPEARILVLGLAFKEDTPDLRNTRAIDIVHELEDYGATVAVHDPVVDAEEARDEFGVTLVDEEALARDSGYDAAILTVAHRAIVERGAEGIREWLKPDGYLFDVKYALGADDVDGRL